jgi:hypothetical protein
MFKTKTLMEDFTLFFNQHKSYFKLIHIIWHIIIIVIYYHTDS